MIYRFTEVLNDLVNYFLLGDILLLEDWKQANHLSDDLAMEFTTNESGDRIFAEGIVIPMTGIENYPYTILFNLSGDRPELCKERNRLQLRKSGYSLKVDHNMLMLFTWPILEQFSPTVVAAAITSRKAKNSLPTHILLENVPGLAPTSLLLLEQRRTIDRKRLRGYIGRISKEKMLEVDAALAISIGIGYPNERRTHNV